MGRCHRKSLIQLLRVKCQNGEKRGLGSPTLDFFLHPLPLPVLILLQSSSERGAQRSLILSQNKMPVWSLTSVHYTHYAKFTSTLQPTNTPRLANPTIIKCRLLPWLQQLILLCLPILLALALSLLILSLPIKNQRKFKKKPGYLIIKLFFTLG